MLLKCYSHAQTNQSTSPLTELPFGIVIGETKNEEIENRGTCIQLTADKAACHVYDMAGNFYVYTSQNQVVNKIRFSAADGNKLPRKWRELGLAFGITDEPGTLDIDFMNIIKNNGAKYIDTSRAFDSAGEVHGIEFSFEIDDLSYSVLIRTDTKEQELKGMHEVVITESY